jgi:hypothetical protein
VRLFVIAAMIVSFSLSPAMPAFAQGHHKKTDQPKTDTPAVKANDKDYKAAIDRLPTPTQKYDPWGGMRPPDQKP